MVPFALLFTRFVFAFGFPSPQDIANAIMGALGAAILGFFHAAGIVSTLLAPFATLYHLIVGTPPGLTYANPAVIAAWQGMVFAADALLLVLVVMSGGLQRMVGLATGTIYIPARDFIPKVFAGAIAINASLL